MAYNAGSGTPTAFASHNSISRNTGAGILQQSTGIVHTRSNNASEQVPATIGTVTRVGVLRWIGLTVPQSTVHARSLDSVGFRNA